MVVTRYIELIQMIDIDENSFTSINQTYKIWKKHSPFLYNLLQSYSLPTSSQTVDYFSDYYLENDWKIASILVGTNSLSENSVMVLSVGIPTNDALTDYTSYREELPEVGVGANGYIGTLGAQSVVPKISIPQASEVMRARINKRNENLIAVKTGGGNAQLLVYDLRNKEEELENGVVKLLGHEQQGFGLAWSPLEGEKLLSGSDDKRIILFNVEAPGEGSVWNASEGVEDVKWSYFNQNIFASAQQDEKICLWDTRSGEDKPSISRKAHAGEVYSIDFNKKSEHLLLSGGEDSDINFWDLRNLSKKLHTFVGHNDAVTSVSWNPENSMQFASGSNDRRIVVWDIDRLNSNSAQKSGNQILFIHGGHRSKITDLSWTKDRDTIASCEEGNTLQLWRINERVLEQ